MGTHPIQMRLYLCDGAIGEVFNKPYASNTFVLTILVLGEKIKTSEKTTGFELFLNEMDKSDFEHSIRSHPRSRETSLER